MAHEKKLSPYPHAAGGWGSLKEVGSALRAQKIIFKGARTLLSQNKPDGFACVSCSWAKPAHPHLFEFCESGVKATAWEITSKRLGPDFFERHTIADLLQWSDRELESAGRLTTPMRWDAASDRYLQVGWDEAFTEIGCELQALSPESVVFYSSGRASLETSYMFQLMVRMYGCNNLPDSSNMCHESSSVGLLKSIGVGIGTVTLEDFEKTDCLFFFGQNVGTNSPRMLHQLQAARKRDVPIVTFNPIREPGLVRFVNPQSPLEMLTPMETRISTQYLQVKTGGDCAALMGLCKAVIAADDAALKAGGARVLDMAFITEHTSGFEDFSAAVRKHDWPDIERESGLSRAALEQAASVYIVAEKVMGIYGMGMTQHRNGVQNVQMLINFLLLRGNIGKPGAGICPVRGHSNVQGQRTVGITEKPELAPLDKLREQFHFEPPRKKGLNTVETCKGILDATVRGFIGLGGNFAHSTPETILIEEAWRKLRISVQISTKLNRSHLIHGEISYILPCLGRIEIDHQASGEQAVSMEDSTGCMHGSRGKVEPAGKLLRSESAIVAGIAKATLEANSTVPWDDWVGDYSKIRDAIAETYPDIFHDFNTRMWMPGGFRRPVPAAHRKWKTSSKRANFVVPDALTEDPDLPPLQGKLLRLFTLRSDSQFNTTIYTDDDRFRGVYGGRRVLLMNPEDMARLGFEAGDLVDAFTVSNDDISRHVDGLKLIAFDLPKQCVGGYYPECNPLIPLWHHAKDSMVPAAKSITIELHKSRII